MSNIIIKFDEVDIQYLSLKCFGDQLTQREVKDMEQICSPAQWSKVDDGGYEGALAPLIQAVTNIIGLVRMDRRGKHEASAK
jgi:hypothetical protein